MIFLLTLIVTLWQLKIKREIQHIAVFKAPHGDLF